MELSSTSASLLLILLLTLVYFLYLHQDPKRKPRTHGLKSYPVVGTLPHFINNKDRFLEWSTGVMKRSPTHTMSFKELGLTGGVITANPANVEHILKANFGNYPKGELAVSLLEDFLGHGIFNSDGEQWLWQRKAASYEFNKRSLRNFVVDTVRFEVVERLLPLLEYAGRHGRTLDVQDVLERFAFDNICRVAFDEDPACLTEESMAAPQSAEFMRAFNDAQNAILDRKQPHAHGLKSYPVVGTLPHFVKNRDRFLEWSTGVMKRSPTHTISFKGLGLTAGAITANPANVEHGSSPWPRTFLAAASSAPTVSSGCGSGRPPFNKRSLRNFVVDSVRFEVVERLLPLLEQAAGRDGRTLDVQDVLERFAFDNICRVAFDEDPACLTEESMATPQSAEFMRAFNDAQNTILSRFLSPAKSLWRAKRLFNMEPERRMREAINTVHTYTERIVRERREREEAGLARRDDFLSRFAAGGEHSDESLRDVVTNFLMAGRDSTSSALTWFFWLLSDRPDVEGKIVHEIRAVRSASISGGMGSTTFSLDELRDMHYLHAAITESMRLYPPVPIKTRTCKEEDSLPDGTFVGKGWHVTYCAYAMGRMEDIWGADCEEFRPERWLDEAGVFRPESPFKYPIYIPRWAKDVHR
uniref:Cytochrome P450 n=1 Tax=Oryza glumipatula TaxID=40148 RepID=A0A0D9YGA0_9ORYZ